MKNNLKYSLLISVWKSKEGIYDDPDESKVVGNYYSEDAAKVDAAKIEFKLMCIGYAKIRTEIVDNTRTTL